jgi:uncharacterized membrane protein
MELKSPEPSSIVQQPVMVARRGLALNNLTPQFPNPHSEQLPIIFLILGAFLAFAYAVIVPPFQVPDEDRHLWRAYSVSDLYLLGPARTQIPASFVVLHNRFPPWPIDAPYRRAVRAAELASWLRQPLKSNSTVGIENPRANLYSFVPYLTTSLVLKVGRLAEWPPLMLLYTGRLANAAVYLLLIYISLRILPEFRLLLLAIALSPMSLHLAASFSADSFTLALTALFTAYVFRLAFDESVAAVRSRDLLVLAVLLLLLALCKFNVWTALLVALIPARKFGSRTKAAMFAAGCMLVALLVAFIWQNINALAVSAFRTASAADGKLNADNMAFLFHHPFRFFGLMLFTDAHLFWIWWQEFVGVFGSFVVWMSPLHVFMYTGAIAVAACTQSARVRISRSQKVVAACFILLTVISLHALLWVFETHVPSLQQALDHWVFIRGIQGRYFLPLALPAVVLVKRRFQLNGLLVVGVLALVAGINLFALVQISFAYS